MAVVPMGCSGGRWTHPLPPRTAAQACSSPHPGSNHSSCFPLPVAPRQGHLILPLLDSGAGAGAAAACGLPSLGIAVSLIRRMDAGEGSGGTIQSRTWLRNSTAGRKESPGMTDVFLRLPPGNLLFSGRKPHAGGDVMLGSHRAGQLQRR